VKIYEYVISYTAQAEGEQSAILFHQQGKTRGHDVNDATQVLMLILRTQQGEMIPEATGVSYEILEGDE
jgi:hypothetical protein